MVRVTFLLEDGESVSVEGEAGTTLMDAAVDNLVPGVLAECGGACVCATCHCIATDEWADKLPEKSEQESGMLEFAVGVEDNSRLSCQIKLTEQLDGLQVRVPADQI